MIELSIVSKETHSVVLTVDRPKIQKHLRGNEFS